MIRLGVSDYSFSSYKKETGCSYAELCRMVKEMGFDGIEFVTLDAAPEERVRVAKEIKALCDSLSLPIFSYTVGANFLADDPMKTVQEVKEAVDIAALLGAPVMRHDAAFSLKALPSYTWKDGVREMASYIRMVAEYAKQKGVRTASENHGYIYQDPERVLALIEAVGHENYGWLFDMGNFSVVDRTATEAIGMAMPHIFHVHAKDMSIKSGSCIRPEGYHVTRGGNYWRGTVLGYGDVPVAQTLRSLAFLGYDGTVSLEFEGCENNLFAIRAGLAYMKDCLLEK